MVVAFVVEAFEAKSEEKMFWAVKVFAVYAFGMVVDESMKYIALVVDHARPTLVKYAALVVEKKKPLSIEVRYDDESDVVAMTLPCAFVERRAFAMFPMARLVVVALVPVALPKTNRPVRVVDADVRPVENVRSDVVALPGNGSWSVAPVASVPQLKTPAEFALTSQLAAFKFETMS